MKTRIIDGSSDDKEICEKFAEMFSGINVRNSNSKHEELQNDFFEGLF